MGWGLHSQKSERKQTGGGGGGGGGGSQTYPYVYSVKFFKQQIEYFLISCLEVAKVFFIKKA